MSKQATPPPPGDKPTSKAPPPPPGWRHSLWPIAIIAAFFLWLVLPAVHATPSTTLTYSQFLTDAGSKQIKTLDIAAPGGTSSGTLTKNNANYTVVIPEQAGQAFLDQMKADGVTLTASTAGSGAGAEIFSWLLLLGLPLLIFGFLWYRLSKGAGGQLQGVLGAGRSRAKVFDEERPSTTFADVAGYEGAKAEISEVVDFLRNPDRYARVGALVPRGRGRGQGAVLLGHRVQLRGAVRRGGRVPGPGPVLRGPQARARDHLHRRDRRDRAAPRGLGRGGLQRRAGTDAQPAAGRDGRVRALGGCRGAGRHQPARGPGPGPAPAGPLRPPGHDPAAERHRAHRHPRRPRQGQEAGPGRRPERGGPR